jgi:hypothetical protein
LLDLHYLSLSPDSHHIFPAEFAADGEEQRADSQAQAQEGNQKSKEEVQDIMNLRQRLFA